MKQLAGLKQLRLALRIYDRLVAEGSRASAVSYSCLISFAAEVGEVSRAVGFFERLSELTTPSIRAYMTMLKIYSKMLNWPASLAILRDMQHRGVRVDTWLSMFFWEPECLRQDFRSGGACHRGRNDGAFAS